MVEGDKDKTAFFAGEGVFCYQKMPFGLKNARATYQRLVDKVFQSTSKENMLADIKETLERKEAKGWTDMKSENTKLSCEWKLYTNGSARSDGSGAGLMLIDPKGKEYTYALCFGFETTKNVAEYEALLAGL
ncbi:reverse transcriptase domain-containing protein [Tanacetum coccineum]